MRQKSKGRRAALKEYSELLQESLEKENDVYGELHENIESLKASM